MKTAPALLALLALPILGGCGSGAPAEPVANAAPSSAPATNAGTANVAAEEPIANEATMANVPGSATNAATNDGVPVPTQAEVDKQLAEMEKTYDEQIAKVTDPEQRAKLEAAKTNALTSMRAVMTARGVK